MGNGYEHRPADLGDGELRKTSALLRRVYRRSSFTERYLAWQYRANPDGKALGCNAWAGDDLVGHVAGMPLRARIEGRELRGLFLLNAAVHPAHTRHGLMPSITRGVVKHAEHSGYDFCIGMGNRFSTRLFLRGWEGTSAYTLVAPLEARIGFGAPRRRPRDAEPSFERLWSEAALAWRLGNPERRYAVRRNGRARVVAPTGHPGIGALLGEWDEAPAGVGGNGRAAGPLRVWIGLDPWIDWRRSAYVRIPDRLRPSPLNFFYRPLAGAPPRVDAARALFRAVDFDPF